MSEMQRTPILGILNGDAPSARMIVVVFRTATAQLTKWAYASYGHPIHPGSYELSYPENFTPLSQFGVHATLMPEGLLAVYQLSHISVARYPDGKPRHWQGANLAKLQLIPKFGGYVVEAVRLDFESRRDNKPEEVANFREQVRAS